MKTIRTIATIAWFEMLILFRSWFFRIFSGLILFFLFGINIGMLNETGGNWAIKAISANVPYFNIVFLSLTQTFIAMFLALDFLKRDKKLDTSEVIYTRSMSNWAYVWGKTFGILAVFTVLNILVLIMALIINLVMPDISLNLPAYVYYPLIISIPSLIFILGLSFLVMSVVKNQAIALVILLGYTGLIMFFGKDKFDYVFDFIGFRLPMVHSDLIGFGYEGRLLIHRGIYLLFGLSFISASIVLLKRLPQSRMLMSVSWIMMAVLAAVAIGGVVYYTSSNASDIRFRSEAIALNDKYSKTPVLNLDQCHLAISHSGRSVSIEADMDLTNRTIDNITQTVFSLNPGLTLESLLIEGQSVLFEQNKHLVLINLPGNVTPGGSIHARFIYKGAIDERICFLDIKEEQAAEKWGPDFVISIRKRHAVVEPSYVLITPESAWYPTPGVLHGSSLSVLPAWNFTRFKATVSTSPDLQPVMQGLVGRSGDSWTFEPENPLPGFTLIIGPYQESNLEADGMSFNLHLIKGHDYFSATLDSISDTLPKFIGDMKQDLERRLGLKYAYPRLKIVEVPVQFYSYSRLWITHRDFLQPEMVLLPERGAMLSRAGFVQEYKMTEKRAKRNEESLSEKEMQLRVLRNFISENFIPGTGDFRMRFDQGPMNMQMTTEKRYSLFPQFFTFVNHVGSDEFPIMNTALEAYISNTGDTQMGGFGMSGSGLSAAEQANVDLQKQSLKELLSSDADNTALRQVIEAKGKYFFTYLEALAGSENFMPFLLEELARFRYQTYDLDSLLGNFELRFENNVDDLAGEWYTSKILPSYLIGNVRVIEIQQDDRTRYQLLFDVSNPSNSGGLLQITLRAGGRGGMGGRGGAGGMRTGSNFALAGRNAATDKFLVMPAGLALQVGYVLDDQPRAMTVNTMVSTNLPNNISYPFPQLEKVKGFVPVEGMKPIPMVTTMANPGEIIIDNEDPGFSVSGQASDSRLVKWLKINKKDDGLPYKAMTFYPPPQYWTPIIQSGFYGDFVRSAVYVKSGDGNVKAEWKTIIQKPGYYDVYAYINPFTARMGMRRQGGGPGGQGGPGGGPGGGSPPEINDEYHFVVYHDEGPADVTLALNTAETGWNSLGSFYFSADTATVVLTDKNTGKTVVADAVKWVQQK